MALRAAASIRSTRLFLTSQSCRVASPHSSREVSLPLTRTNVALSIRSFATSHNETDNKNASDDTIMVSIADARATTTRALEKIGWDHEDASLQAEIMVAAELCGNNQGLVKMYQPSLMQPAPHSGKPTIERSTSNSAVLNANQAPGMLAAVMAADKAMELCRAGSSVSIVCTHNTSTSSGQLAFYAERMARAGFVGVCLANSPEMVAAVQGGKAVFGTNPLAVGVPVANSHPFTVSLSRVESQ